MTKQLIRDFIYLDIERIRSFLAQATGGLVSESTTGAEHSVGIEASATGGLPLVAKASGDLDYHYLKSQSETKSFHDAIFGEFHRSLQSIGAIVDWSDMNSEDWLEENFKDGALLMVKGATRIVDYKFTE